MNISPVQLLEYLRARYYFQDSPSFLQKILIQYPQFRYHGPAYRAVILGVDEKFIKNSQRFLYTSFAKSFSGINAFLMNYYKEGSVDVNRVVLVEGIIEGLDLSLVINYLESEGLVLDEVIYQLKREEEVITTEVSYLKKLNNDYFWNTYVLSELDSLRSFLGYVLDKKNLGSREWDEVLHQIHGINFLNHLLGINDLALAQADLYLNSVSAKESPDVIGHKLHELGFVIPEPYQDLSP
jgi:hypothetical protein